MPPAKKSAAKKAGASPPAAKKSTAKKAAAKSASAETAPAKKAPEKKSGAKKTTTAKKAPAKKAAAKKAAPASKPEAHDHDHDHDHGHDHDHDHDHEHEELSEEERALAERDVERMGEALAALDDTALRAGLNGMSEKSRGELAGRLNMPRATMYLGDALVPLVRRKLRSASPDRQLQATFAIVERVNDATIEALGDRSQDPSHDDMIEVLPNVIETHGTPLVTAMLAGYAASDAPCRPVMRELLENDERFAIGEEVALEELASAAVSAPVVVDEKALEVKREQRRAAKEAKREAELKAKEAKRDAQEKRRAAVHASRRKHK
jgi:predicted thioesterase